MNKPSYTPEGLDQNPAYYELLQEAAFKAAAERNVTDWLVQRAYRRYGLQTTSTSTSISTSTKVRNPEVAAAWAALGASGYAFDKGVSDATGVCQMGLPGTLGGLDTTGFESDQHTPTPKTCLEWSAWNSLNAAAPAVAAAAAASPAALNGGSAERRPLPEPYVYDLVNTAREVMAQLSTPMLRNFSAALNASVLSTSLVNETAARFVELLSDMELLLATDSAFMLGPWLESARKLGGTAQDCINTRISGDIGACNDFMEWNARAQLTSWYPVLGSSSNPVVQQNGRDHDYARKQWSGLVRDVFIPRANLYRDQAFVDAAAGQIFNSTAIAEKYASFLFDWQTGYPSKYALAPAGDPVAVSAALYKKWAPYFNACPQ